MSLDPHALHIFVDGSSFKNPGGESGYAGYAVDPESGTERQILFHGVRESTTNRMELTACIAALKWLRDDRALVTQTRVQLVTDSLYVTQNLSRA